MLAGGVVSSGGHYLRSNLLVALERYDEALVEAMRYADLAGYDADAFVLAGNVYIGRLDFASMEAAFGKALEDDPDHAVALAKSIFFMGEEDLPTIEAWYADMHDPTATHPRVLAILEELEHPEGIELAERAFAASEARWTR